MKALRKMRPEAGAQLESVSIPTFGPSDVLIRVRAASICGRMTAYSETGPAPKFALRDPSKVEARRQES